MKRRNRIRTLLYGDQHLSPEELDLLHTPSLQRLYDLHQLGFADRVFVDASHSRLHHVVGVLEQVDKLGDAIIRNLEATPDRLLTIAMNGKTAYTALELAHLVDERRPIARLIGLLHDLTHAPFGHTVEDEIELVACKHDDPVRQADAFYRLLCQYLGWLAKDVELPRLGKGATSIPQLPKDLSAFLDRPDLDPPSEPVRVAEFTMCMLEGLHENDIRASWRLPPQRVVLLLAHLHVAMTALLHIELLHSNNVRDKHLPRTGSYPFQELIEAVLQRWSEQSGEDLLTGIRFRPQRDAYLLDIVGNTVCADLLDYAQRDSHFSNIRLSYDSDRVAENFTLVSWDASTYPGGDGKDRREFPQHHDPFRGKCLRTAISLFSHKLRIDVPGELMNLLNVRYYIYERVLFHPTKCAAGAMLGTSLQLLGWRPLDDTDKAPEDILPPRLRHVGDAVFLNDIAAGASLALEVLAECREKDVPPSLGRKIALLRSCPQIDVARDLVSRRVARPVAEAVEEIRAGLELLNRLRARRYYRPVFRNLPNSKYRDAGPNELAAAFLNPQTRYKAEREIERRAGLAPGTVVIHCPPRRPAQKIANVLLILPEGGDGPIIRKLRHIHEIDREVFCHHQKAITAVEEMYASMWRLVVYVSPRYLKNHSAISEVVGRVIVQTLELDVEGSGVWPNDPHFERELVLNFSTESPAVDGSPTGERLVPTSHDTVAAPPLTPESYTVVEWPQPSVDSGSENGKGVRTELLDQLASLMTKSDFSEGRQTLEQWIDNNLTSWSQDERHSFLSAFVSHVQGTRLGGGRVHRRGRSPRRPDSSRLKVEEVLECLDEVFRSCLHKPRLPYKE